MEDQPTQPLTGQELADIRESAEWAISADNAFRLLNEVDRLRAELHEAHRTAGAEHGRAAALEAAYRETCTARDARDTEIERLRAENTARGEQIKELASVLERPAAEPDEEFDAVRERALKWAGGKEVKDLLDAFDWLRAENTAQAAGIAEVLQMHRLEGYLINPIITKPSKHFGCFVCKTDGPCPTRRALGLDQDGQGQANADR